MERFRLSPEKKPLNLSELNIEQAKIQVEEELQEFIIRWKKHFCFGVIIEYKDGYQVVGNGCPRCHAEYFVEWILERNIKHLTDIEGLSKNN